MQTTWILTADTAEGFIYKSAGGKSELVEHAHFEHPESRLHDRDLTTDLPGRAYDSAGHGRHAMEQSVDPKKHEAERFAKELLEYLHRACSNGACEKLYVAAPPAFLGMLRGHYSKPVQQALKLELDSHLVDRKPDELRKRLPEYL
jgi:protein required for attachment to host cells